MSELAQVEAQRLGGAQLVRVSGEIDLSNAHDIMNAVAGAAPDDASLVILDLSDTAYLDSSAIAMLFRLAERLRYRRQDLRVVVPADAPIRAVLELTDLPHVIPLDDAIPEIPTRAERGEFRPHPSPKR